MGHPHWWGGERQRDKYGEVGIQLTQVAAGRHCGIDHRFERSVRRGEAPQKWQTTKSDRPPRLPHSAPAASGYLSQLDTQLPAFVFAFAPCLPLTTHIYHSKNSIPNPQNNLRPPTRQNACLRVVKWFYRVNAGAPSRPPPASGACSTAKPLIPGIL